MINYRQLQSIASESLASQDKFELFHMLVAVAQLEPKKILEVGVHSGNNLKNFARAFPNAELYGIETETQHLVFKDFTLIEGDSTDLDIVARTAKHGPFDFIFIDGDHTYSVVKDDWENYSKLVRPGGAIGFHDTSRMGKSWDTHVEVRKFLDEIWATSTHKCVEFWNGRDNPGIAIIYL